MGFVPLGRSLQPFASGGREPDHDWPYQGTTDCQGWYWCCDPVGKVFVKS